MDAIRILNEYAQGIGYKDWKELSDACSPEEVHWHVCRVMEKEIK